MKCKYKKMTLLAFNRRTRAPGSDPRETLRAPAPNVARQMKSWAWGDVLTCLSLSYKNGIGTTEVDICAIRIWAMAFYILKMTQASERLTPGGSSGFASLFLVDVFPWLASIWVSGCLCCSCRSRWWQTCQKHCPPSLIFIKLSRCEKRFGKWITMLKIINIMNPVQKQHLFRAIVLKKIEDKTGIKSFRFIHLPFLSEEMKLLIIADLSTCAWNLIAFSVLTLLDFLFSWEINVFRAPPSSSMLMIRLLKWFAADIDSAVFIVMR